MRGFTRTFYWNNNLFEVTRQPKTIISAIDPTFSNINKLFFQSLKVGENDPTRNSFLNYYMSLVEIKDLMP